MLPPTMCASLPLAALAFVVVLTAGCGDAPRNGPEASAGVASVAASAPAGRAIARRPLGRASLSLHVGADGVGALWVQEADGPPRPVPCDRLVGAWGLWVDDVDGDGRSEAIVALRKPARYDPRVDNRLHVYGFEDGRCVPAWRGTRLAGRFDALGTAPDEPGTIIVSERLGPSRRRVARYRWNDFGYAVADVLWQGQGNPPPDLVADLVVAPSEPS